jgi:hypothetical protein
MPISKKQQVNQNNNFQEGFILFNFNKIRDYKIIN